MHIRRSIGWPALAASLAFLPGASAGIMDSRPVLNVPDASVYTTRMRMDPDGTPRALYRVESRAYEGTAEEAARTFLADHAGQLRLGTGTSVLATEGVIQAPGGAHVRFQQHYEGIPVLGADVVVSLTATGRVGMVLNNFQASIHLPDVTPAISSGDALQAARAVLKTSGPSIGKTDEAHLVVYRDSVAAWRLAYRVLITCEEPSGDWDIIVDAHSGDVLMQHDRFVNHTDEFVQGTGMVYLQDPLTAARQLYGTPGFSDNNDADSDSLALYRTPVVLDSLRYEDGVYKLQGPYCAVTDIETPADPLFYGSATPDGFAWTRSEQAFEAVNVYYHVTTSCRYLETLGFSIPHLRDIRLDPHGFQGQDNSHFSPSGNWISWGEGGVDDAEDADVIWHEYGHAIQFAIVPSWGGGESGALGEGISDYWAASYGRSIGGWTPAEYHYEWIFDWDGHNPFWAGRILNDQRTYPFGAIPIHSAGQIVSAGLMGIQGALGREITDRLVIKALCYLGSGIRAPDFAQAVIQADLDIYDGVHLSTLVYWLGTVKHFVDPEQYVSGVGDDAAIPGSFSLGRNYPNPFNPSTTIHFALPEQSMVRLEVFDVNGRLVATLRQEQMAAGTHTAGWDGRNAEGLPAGSGVYFYRLRAEGSTGVRHAATGSMLLVK
jgi:zinc metalloprotease ZmpB